MSFKKYPYTNYADKNLDYLIGKVGEVETHAEETKVLKEAAEAAKVAAETAKGQAEAAQNGAKGYREISEAYGRGTVNGAPVQPGQIGYQDNAKYYKEQAALQVPAAEAAAEAVVADTNDRFDNAVSAVTTDTEVIDIRVAENGEVYPTAGAAVRGQIRKLKTLAGKVIESRVNEIDDLTEYSEFLYDVSLSRVSNNVTKCYSPVFLEAGVTYYFRKFWGNFTWIAEPGDASGTHIPGFDSGVVNGSYTPSSNVLLYITSEIDSIPLLTTSEEMYDANEREPYFVPNKLRIEGTKVNDQITDLSYADEGLYTGGRFFEGEWENIENWTMTNQKYRGMTVITRSSPWSGAFKRLNVEAGKTYVFSVWVKETGAKSALQIAIKRTAAPVSTADVSPENVTYDQYIIDLGEWRHYGLIFKANTSGTVCPLVQSIESGATLYMAGYAMHEIKDCPKHVYRVEQDGSGDFTSLVSAITFAGMFMNSDVYVGSGEWDVISEFGNYYMTHIDENARFGLVLKNRMNVVCSSDSVIVADYTGSSDDVMLYFSPLNSGANGFTLNNANVKASKVRYCMHDERRSESDRYENVYINCKMFLDNSENTATDTNQCIGGGLGTNGEIRVIGGYYDCINELHTPLVYSPISYHNAAYEGKSKIDISGVYFAVGSPRLNWYGVAEQITEAHVHDCSMAHEVQNYAETPESLIENVIVRKWNNEIRTGE